MKVHPSALKHGVSAEYAVHAAHRSQWVEPLELVIHAMPARKQYLDLLP